MTTTSFAPPVDIYEDEHNITLKLEVPGIDEKDIDVRIDNNTLTLHGRAKPRRKRKKRTSVASSGNTEVSPVRSRCPAPLDPGQVSADYNKGVLNIKLAKKAEAEPSRSKSMWAAKTRFETKALEAKAPGGRLKSTVKATEMGGEGVRIASLLLKRTIHCPGQHDDWRLRPKSPHLDGYLLPVLFGHEVIQDYNVN